ncbi:helix-turn-helix transcriptional regulator [Neobittarella massiliensis]|uniref:Helix-turn-helix transcriptional regulator n=1 Tax=Neobittarella massiliensis (ex Bilen et al. 2018) TaxID=2041842 RepID=A0A8J6IK81_9FIRM|nr:helix-turn-helix transcriptional regulator [Neobittarella massiliensis]MBC3515084.1 helix-turn-helix transcriptional regulator [Neobittarella massiliensis]
MDIGNQIKKFRTNLQLSQEMLAEKMCVSRQTVSNWETQKSYPDIHRLLQLGALFQVSLDQLLEGDIERMRQQVEQKEIDKLNRYSAVYAVFLPVTVLAAVPLVKWWGLGGALLWTVLLGATLIFALRLERLKRRHDIQTYREIVAFMENRPLNGERKQQKLGKRPYQKILLAIGSAVSALLLCAVLWSLFSH